MGTAHTACMAREQAWTEAEPGTAMNFQIDAVTQPGATAADFLSAACRFGMTLEECQRVGERRFLIRLESGLQSNVCRLATSLIYMGLAETAYLVRTDL